MPRKTPIRSRSQVPEEPDHGQAHTPDYRAWLRHWKESAVQKLPSSAPLEIRTKLRKDVEASLAPYGPEAGQQEIADIVLALTNGAKAVVFGEGNAKQRLAQKEQLLSRAELGLSLALNRCPTSLVGKPGSNKRIRKLNLLRPQLRQALTEQLTGDESMHALVQRVEEWVASWVVKENPNIERREFLEEAAKWSAAGLGGALALSLMHPQVRDGIARGARTLGDRLAPYEPFLKFVAEAIVPELGKKPAA